ncbi:MAG: hypothetical protein ACI9T7_002199 [Oleiphilaceae bacterium]
MKETRLVSISFLMIRLKKLKVIFKIYKPQITANGLNVDIKTQKVLLNNEYDHVQRPV